VPGNDMTQLEKVSIKRLRALWNQHQQLMFTRDFEKKKDTPNSSIIFNINQDNNKVESEMNELFNALLKD
jgi:hypothetical protein